MVIEFLVEDQDQSGRLDDLEGFRDRERLRDPVRQASLARHPLAAVFAAGLVHGFSPWLKEHLDTGRETIRRARGGRRSAWPPPDAGEIRLSIGRSRCGRCQIRRAVGRARDPGLRNMEPLRRRRRGQHARERKDPAQRARLHVRTRTAR